MSEIIIGKEKQYVKITVAGKTYPGSSDRWDGGWLNSNIDLSLGCFKGSFNANLRVDEFERFLKDLRNLDKTLKGKAAYQSIEEWLIIDIENADSLGNFNVRVTAKDSLGGHNKITGLVVIDQTFFRSIIKAIEAMLANFVNE
jgi:hypothetical protein